MKTATQNSESSTGGDLNDFQDFLANPAGAGRSETAVPRFRGIWARRASSEFAVQRGPPQADPKRTSQSEGHLLELASYFLRNFPCHAWAWHPRWI